MEAIKLPLFSDTQKQRRRFDVLGFSNLSSLSRNSTRAHLNRNKSCGGEQLQMRLDRSCVTGNSAISRIIAPVSTVGKQRNSCHITQAFTEDGNSRALRNKSSSSSSFSHDEITESIDKNVKFMIRQRIVSTLSAFGFTALVFSVPEYLHTNVAEASQFERLGQIRQGVTVIERAVEGLSKFRLDPEAGVQVLDKALTVVTGSTIVDPEVLDQKVEAFIKGETDIPEELRKTVLDTVQGSWSNLVDVVTNFNPVTVSESAGTSFQGFVEAGVERFAAFEISALVTLGERWLILTPLVVLPMAWQMKRNKEKSDERAREEQNKAEVLGAEAQARTERVKRELERIELKTLLLDAVNSLGEMALQPPRARGESGLIRRRIQDILERLAELNPVDDALQLIPEVASSISASADPSDLMANVPKTPTIDGDWRLIYISETNNSGGDQELPQLPGIALDNIRQKVWQASTMSSTITSDIPSPLLTRNTAEVRLGPFGVLEIAVQGSWENLENGQTALVSFDTFSARPVEVLGNRITNDLPQLDITIPRSLQQRAEWGVVYVDNHIRINRGRIGQLFLFTRAERKEIGTL